VLRIIAGHAEPELTAARGLFLEYAAGLQIDLSKQGFDAELASLPGLYAPPRGTILLATCDESPAGCVAIRPIDVKTCEMKRLFVKSGYRRQGIGRALAAAIIAEARRIGYRRMLLDTLESMHAARGLYSSIGFVPTKPYGHHPYPGTQYLELAL
jgi:putative acetyltransferase